MKIKIIKVEELKNKKYKIDEEGSFTFEINNLNNYSIVTFAKKIINFLSGFDTDSVELQIEGFSSETSNTFLSYFHLYSKILSLSATITSNVHFELSNTYSKLAEIYVKYMYLIDSTSNIINPESFVNIIKEELIKHGLCFEALVNEIIVDENSPLKAIYAVGKAGMKAPRLVIVEFGKSKLDASQTYEFCLVGKGVCYDTGGLSLKPSFAMEGMHKDMGGSALAFFSSLTSYLLTKKPIVCVLGLVENLIGPNAYRPGDVIGSYSGKTICVLNTDAEGRVVLADAVNYASKHINFKNIIVMATLTGALKVCLGDDYTGYFTDSETMNKQINTAKNVTSEYAWRLPNDQMFLDLLTVSKVADIQNISSGYGGAGTITGGKFIEFFFEKKSNQTYTHFDIANYYNRDLLVGHSSLNLLSFMSYLTSKYVF